MIKTKVDADSEPPWEELRESGQLRKIISAVLLLGIGLTGVLAQSVKDIEGNVYKTIKIGTQVWMVENLRTTKFNDGTRIPLVTDAIVWSNLSTPGYCWYDNNAAAYKVTYGALYNWYAVNTGKLCPTGWHVPSNREWKILTGYLGGEDMAGGKLKESDTIHWISPNTGTNESGFTAFPGGARQDDGLFGALFLSEIGLSGFWWSSTDCDVNTAWQLDMVSWDSGVMITPHYKVRGHSVRCLLLVVQSAVEFFNRGVAKNDLQDYIGAIADFTKAIELDPTDAETYYARGYAKLYQQDYIGSIADLTNAIEINPNYGQAYISRGYTKSYLQDYRGAIADYTKAIKIDPTDARAYYGRGLAKIALGQKESGCLDLSKAGELGLVEAYEAIKKFCQ